MTDRPAQPVVVLPPPDRSGTHPLERVIDGRRSVRDYGARELGLAQAGQLLWAGQGMTRDGNGRAVPSAGAVYPLSLALAAGRVSGLAPGVYHYLPNEHCLAPGPMTDIRLNLAEAAIEDQPWLRECASVIAISGRISACENHFGEQPPRGERARRYLYLEAGHVAQSIYLQATALNLGAVFVGAYEDATVAGLLGLGCGQQVLGLMPVGAVKRP